MVARSILFLLLLTRWQIIGGVQIKSCGEGNMIEIKPGETRSFRCTSNTGYVEWTLVTGKSGAHQRLAVWENNLQTYNDFDKTFVAKSKYELEINAVNNRKIHDDVSIVNGSLLCKTGRETATCGLSYVDAAQGTVCTAMATSWNVTVSCNISSAYSSRRIYTCHLSRKHNSVFIPLQTIAMTTSVTSQLIANNEFKVSGNCLFYTQLPAIEGKYDYYVVTSPGRSKQTVVNTGDRQSLTVKRPASPNVSCHPGGHVLENTEVSCVCRTTSLGQPQGSLRWMVGYGANMTSSATTELGDENSSELRYNRTLTMSDHGKTWLRCQLVWGAEELRGDTYMASVGRKPRSLSDDVIAMTNMQFDVIAFPKPHNATLMYLGTSPTTNIPHPDSQLSIISLDCNSYPDDFDRFNCSLVSSANSSEMESGFYRLVVVNEVGEGILTVRIGEQMNA
ncbi:uncharacterized protein LOC112569267 isoform X2 [Pomacea canaliculata]|uniref:uncharacterized protein LOC112569267 isoform X2 n=1 Tax=Pomacea canaliculata TaxID=400727 RepID=UPI000D738B45|nr:uncharacterized protein LOC112569267 isoform X2 [Pomacea canaliculata]